MADKMRIAVMGMGRLGRSLQQLMAAAPHLEAVPWRRNDPIPCNVDVYWICVSDGAVQEVAGRIPTGNVVLHASGALPVEVLRPHRPAGSLHPLQSFPGPEVHLPSGKDLPAAIAGDPLALAAAQRIADELGFNAFSVHGDRRAYHAAAVIAGNFGTTLLAEASRLLGTVGVDPAIAPKILAPLALASIEQAAQHGPAKALTGPFARGDAKTIAGHLQVLDEKDPQLGEIYRVLGRACLRLGEKNNPFSPEERDALFRLLG
jgi:predicted short-subunit dehydrogenase-like oxidoreductase (DUF2520 family)